jgi:uncharacterized phage-associated protein
MMNKGGLTNMSNQTTALKVAKYFIWKASQEGKNITNKKLQKLLYYAQGWNLVIKGQPLFNDKIEAWVHGPAIWSVYREYKQYGFSPITKKVEKSEVEKLPSQDVLEDVWKVYGEKYDADFLEQLTHNERPWQNAREKAESVDKYSPEIDLKDMRDYFLQILESSNGAAA